MAPVNKSLAESERLRILERAADRRDLELRLLIKKSHISAAFFEDTSAGMNSDQCFVRLLRLVAVENFGARSEFALTTKTVV